MPRKASIGVVLEALVASIDWLPPPPSSPFSRIPYPLGALAPVLASRDTKMSMKIKSKPAKE